jgi:hypothetical protein
MKNAGLAGAIALCGIGLMMIGLGNFVSPPSAMAYTPAVAAAVQDEGEPTIVWYGIEAMEGSNGYTNSHAIYRSWSDGTIEVRIYGAQVHLYNCTAEVPDCITPWTVISSPTEGLNAAADITFDEVVNGEDLATLLASWGDAPRNPMPPSDCPLGLMN